MLIAKELWLLIWISGLRIFWYSKTSHQTLPIELANGSCAILVSHHLIFKVSSPPHSEQSMTKVLDNDRKYTRRSLHGPHRPPELSGDTVKFSTAPLCDIWSLGCILFEVALFAIGEQKDGRGDRMLKAFESSRLKDSDQDDDYYFRKDEPHLLKPSVEHWLIEEVRKCAEQKLWSGKVATLIELMICCYPDDRADMTIVVDQLQKILRHLDRDSVPAEAPPSLSSSQFLSPAITDDGLRGGRSPAWSDEPSPAGQSKSTSGGGPSDDGDSSTPESSEETDSHQAENRVSIRNNSEHNEQSKAVNSYTPNNDGGQGTFQTD